MIEHLIISTLIATTLATSPKTIDTTYFSTSLDGFRKVDMTYYLETDNPCANGEYPTVGVCAYQKEYIGMTALIYVNDDGNIGDLVGIYQISDTGYGRTESNGMGSIQNGNTIDIFMDSDSAGRKFIETYGNDVFVKIID